MADIKIDIKRSGFPVKIGEVELWFETSPESLTKYVESIKGFKEAEKEMQEKVKTIQLPDVFDINADNIEDINLTMTDKAFELQREYIGEQYDLIFGKGTFDKLYNLYPDIEALENALDVVGIAINKKIDELEKERSKKIDSDIDEILNKKQKK